MSAYALPGSIFPSPGGACSSHPNLMNTCTSRPLHHFSEAKEKKGGIGHFSLEEALSLTADDDIKEEEREGDYPAEFGIAVKEAKIDPVRLVQAVSAGKKHAASLARKKTRDLDDTQPAQGSRRTPHEDAIQFELSISFNGRSYSATRTLPRIMELRNDLIRELNSRRKRLQSRRMRWNPKAQDDDDDTVATVYEEEDIDVVIPEIPECDTENVAVNGGGVAGRGFAMLQALLGPYCPAIERWLLNVMDLVPPTDSPSLSRFLWEPVSVDIGSRCGMMRSLSSLECIAEDAGSEEESEQ